MKDTIYKTYLFLYLMRSEVTALCSLENVLFFNNRLVTGKGIKYFKDAAKEMGIFLGAIAFIYRKDFALIFI